MCLMYARIQEVIEQKNVGKRGSQWSLAESTGDVVIYPLLPASRLLTLRVSDCLATALFIIFCYTETIHDHNFGEACR